MKVRKSLLFLFQTKFVLCERLGGCYIQIEVLLMKTYFRVLAILSLLGVAAGIVYISITLTFLKGYEIIGGIIALVLFILVGPAEGLLLAHVARLTEDVEELKQQAEENNRLILEGPAKFLYFKGFEVVEDFDSFLDGKPILAGMTGIVTDEDEHTYKATITIDESKKKIAFSKKEKRIKVFEFLKALEDIEAPNNKTIKANKVGQILETTDNDEYLVEFNLGNESKVEIIVDKCKVYTK